MGARILIQRRQEEQGGSAAPAKAAADSDSDSDSDGDEDGSGDKRLQASVVSMPFYDAEGKRLRI